MALARIISHSQQCSRELALDLLARGYAVEIVSPDAIPDNLADLELRVDSESADTLKATVETHDGAHSASFNFVHHLKSPMVDFRRRPPQATETTYIPVDPILLKVKRDFVELGVGEKQELAFDDISTKLTVFESESTPAVPEVATPAPEADPLPAIVQNEQSAIGEKPIPIVVNNDTPAAALVNNQPERTMMIAPEPIARPGVTITIHRSKSEPKVASSRWSRPPAWTLRAAAASVGMLLVALALGLGMRPSRAALSSNPSVSTPDTSISVASISKDAGIAAKNTTVDTNGFAPSATPHSTVSSPAEPLTAVPEDSNYGKAKPSPSSKQPIAEVKKTNPPPKHISGHADDIVAPDTITYLDHPGAKPIAVREAARRHAHSPRHNGGAIAANTVTYLNGKPAPKAVTPK